jgi:hypothetical protein
MIPAAAGPATHWLISRTVIPSKGRWSVVEGSVLLAVEGVDDEEAFMTEM